MFTVIGSAGFIGSHLIHYLRQARFDYCAPNRGDPEVFSRPLGHVIYCAGYTADFRVKMFETVEAHVCYLKNIIARAQFDSLLYLSSTRVYQGADTTHEESDLKINPHNSGNLYNLSKLMGESLCFSIPKPNMRVVRLSNVYGTDMGPQNFLGSLIHDAVEKKEIVLKTALTSSKDYIAVEDVAPLLVAIATRGKHKLYNLASGRNVTNQQIVECLASIAHCSVRVDSHAPDASFPSIQIKRIQSEFQFAPLVLEEILPKITQSVLCSQKASR